MAKRKAPSLNGSISHERERVPSGKIITETFFLSRSRHCRIASAAESRLPRTSLMSPAICIIQPMNGSLNIVSLLSHFISHGKQLIRNTSAYDS